MVLNNSLELIAQNAVNFNEMKKWTFPNPESTTSVLMNSVNYYFTLNYAQPEEYRFSHDSVFLARQVFELFPDSLKEATCLDLCAGCGIVGLDFLYHCKAAGLPMPVNFDFLEVQNIYREYFEENLQGFGSGLPTVNFLNENYDILKSESYRSRYDLILSNPPYFRMNQGILSPSEFKNRCRFFLDSDFKNLIEAINNALKPKGSAYILMRDLKEHGLSPLSEARKILGDQRSISVVGDIRGTLLVLIK